MTDLEITGCTFQSAKAPTTVPFNDLAAGNQVEPPYQLAFGYLQVPGTSAFSTEPTSQLLHDAAIEQSLFQGVTVPALVMAQIGTLRVDQNTVRNSYAGFWFVSIADPAQLLPFFGEFAAGNPGLYQFLAIAGRSALLDRILVIASAIGQVLPATPPEGEPVVPGKIHPLDTAQLMLARQTLRAILTHAARSGSGNSSVASGATTEAEEVSPPSAQPASAPGQEVTGDAEEAKLTELPPEIDAFLTNLSAPAAAPVPVADTGTIGVSVRLDLCDCQVDAIVADSYSGAGLLVVDLTTETGSALLHDNRIRSRFPMGETVLVTGLAGGQELVGFGEASVTGNVVANEVVPVIVREGTAVLENTYSMVLDAATTPLGVPAVAITGNVFIDPTGLPARQNISTAAAVAGLGKWELLNTVINYVGPPPAVTGLSPAGGGENGGDAVTVTGSGFTGATVVNFGSHPGTILPGQTDTQLTVLSPSVAPILRDLVVDVTVTTPAGTSPIVPKDKFTYVGLHIPVHLESAVLSPPGPEAAAPPGPEAAAPPEPEVVSPTAPEAAAPPEPEAAAPPEPEVVSPTAPEAAAPPAPEAAAPPAPEAAAPPEPEVVSPTAPTQIVPSVPTGPPLRIRVTNSADAGRAFDLHPGELTIGREEGSAIQLQDSTVSHNHALLRVSGENATIEDLRSTNGTKVNGVAIDRQTPLAPGDQIEVGDVKLAVEQHQTTPDEA